MTAAEARSAYTVPEVAERLNMGLRATYAAIERGDIPSVRVGSRNVRVPAHALDVLLGAAAPDPASAPLDAAAIEDAVVRGMLRAARIILRDGLGGDAP